MKLTIYYTFFFLLACGLNTCGEEDILTAEEDDRSSYFMPSPDATDEESVLRRNFYEEEHSYLLFNDTLRHEPLGIDFNGNMQYFTEVLDLSYNVGATSTPTVQYSYTYLSTLTEKQAAVDFMKAHVLNHLNESLRPYSWFLVREISSVSTMDGTLSHPVSISGDRAIAVAIGDIQSSDDMEQDSLGNAVLGSALSGIIASREDALSPFYAICDGLYGQYFDTDYVEEHNLETLRNNGFIRAAISYGWEIMGAYPNQSQDLNDYVNLLFTTTEEEINETYASYPLVLQKCAILRQLISDIGYIE